MEALMMVLTAGGALGVALAVASLAMNATLRLVHHVARAAATDSSTLAGGL
jgi:hypothetical protein